MRGLVFSGNRNSELREFPDPQAGPGEAVVAIRASGLCGSDFKRYRSTEELPGDVIIGHEPCGVIAELGPGAPPGLAVGDRVMVHHYAGCGVCEVCAMGFEQACPSGHTTYGTGAHGSHADFMLVPSRTLIPLPDELTFEEGASISCGTGTAWNGLKKMSVSGRDTVAIFGQGPVGLSGTISAKAMGARVIAVDIVPERLALASALGADHVIDSSRVDPVEEVRALTGGAGASATLETSGNPIARAQVLQALRLFGRCCYVGVGAPATIDVNVDVIRKSVTLYGGWTFSKSELAEIARFMVEGAVPLGDLITHRFSLDEGVEAYRTFDGATTGKCVIVLD
jgi:threonine dehydrogenase-like Zn-dependent dehydrogenase